MTGSAETLARVVVATQNEGKVREFRELLAGWAVPLASLAGFPPVRFPEEGGDYRENAAAKACAAAEQLGEWAIADDSGLEVEALDGGPGPYSARYGGPGLDSSGRVEHLLAELAERPSARAPTGRRARFVCWAALAAPDGRVELGFGECPGTILEAPRGEGGFGYDPVFLPQGFQVSMAELAAETKNEISHRGRALRALLGARLRPRAAPAGP